MITSCSNDKVKQIRKLWKHNVREETQLFLIEGYREISRALAGHIKVKQLFVCENFFSETNEKNLMTKMKEKGVEIFSCSEDVFRFISYRESPDGFIAVAQQKHLSLNELSFSGPALFVVAESIEKPGNLGAILRSSDAVGATAVIVCDRCTDIYNPNVIRASTGTLFTQPVVEACGDEALCWLKKNGVVIVATNPSVKTKYVDVDLTKNVAIVVGREDSGLTDLWKNGADIQVKIPMCGVADSLNVATSATLLLYEAVRQRDQKCS